jgi:DNA-binding HxlR family transcriptional regulator
MKLDFDGCPIEASMGTLGRKWAFLVLRNIGFYRKQRFNDMLRFTPGLTKRVLSMRLGELRRDGYIEVAERGKNYSRWDLTEKGRDALPILMSLVKFGSKWYADKVFSDRAPRALRDVFEESYIKEIIGDPASELLVAPRIRRRTR